MSPSVRALAIVDHKDWEDSGGGCFHGHRRDLLACFSSSPERPQCHKKGRVIVVVTHSASLPSPFLLPCELAKLLLACKGHTDAHFVVLFSSSGLPGSAPGPLLSPVLPLNTLLSSRPSFLLKQSFQQHVPFLPILFIYRLTQCVSLLRLSPSPPHSLWLLPRGRDKTLRRTSWSSVRTSFLRFTLFRFISFDRNHIRLGLTLTRSQNSRMSWNNSNPSFTPKLFPSSKKAILPPLASRTRSSPLSSF